MRQFPEGKKSTIAELEAGVNQTLQITLDQDGKVQQVIKSNRWGEVKVESKPKEGVQ